MTTLRTAAQQALEAICGAKLCEVNSMSSRHEMIRLMDEAITALRAALAEPDVPETNFGNMEPVAAWENKYGMKEWEVHALRAGWMPAPPQRKPLTEEEIDELSRTMVKGDRSVNWLCCAIERAHGITS